MWVAIGMLYIAFLVCKMQMQLLVFSPKPGVMFKGPWKNFVTGRLPTAFSESHLVDLKILLLVFGQNPEVTF